MLNYALYATDKKGNKTEITIFTNDLGIFDQTMLQAEFQNFLKKVLANNEETKTIQHILTQVK
ncbi:MAG: hypothetical protein R2822_20195 [Spirosomataceae bacterium]